MAGFLSYLTSSNEKQHLYLICFIGLNEDLQKENISYFLIKYSYILNWRQKYKWDNNPNSLIAPGILGLVLGDVGDNCERQIWPS